MYAIKYKDGSEDFSDKHYLLIEKVDKKLPDSIMKITDDDRVVFLLNGEVVAELFQVEMVDDGNFSNN